MDINPDLLRKAFTEGDEAAFAELVRLLTPSLRGLARRLTAAESRYESDELLWDTFDQMFVKANQFDSDRGSVRTWASRIMTNLWFDKHRGLRRLTPIGIVNDDVVPVFGKVPDPEAEAVVLRLDIQRALLSLDNTKRALVMLVDYEGFNVPEAASMLQLEESNARFHLRAARKQLRAALGLPEANMLKTDDGRTVSE